MYIFTIFSERIRTYDNDESLLSPGGPRISITAAIDGLAYKLLEKLFLKRSPYKYLYGYDAECLIYNEKVKENEQSL